MQITAEPTLLLTCSFKVPLRDKLQCPSFFTHSLIWHGLLTVLANMEQCQDEEIDIQDKSPSTEVPTIWLVNLQMLHIHLCGQTLNASHI